MPKFNEENQERRIAELHDTEAEELAKILSEKYGLEYVDLSNVSIDTNALRLVPEKEAREASVAGFKKTGDNVALAVRSPNRAEAQAVVADLEERGYSVRRYMVSERSLERAWERYSELSYAVESKAGVLDISGEEIRKTISEMDSLKTVTERISDILGMEKSYRISRILEIVLAGAMAVDASDIHIEPQEEKIRMRFRLDGVLTDILFIDRETYELLRSRIKLLSKLKLNVHDEAQDGRFSIKLDQKEIEIRTSVLPGSYGESIVMRVLDPDTIGLSLEKLGMQEKLLEIVKTEIKRPNGMILTTGPTGSGKTTTLYAFLRSIHTPDIKIVTLEDPIEYHLNGIVQTQVDDSEYTFLSGLRSTLRQDPDVIMVGEIRDNEVAKTAVNASLTGHLVFSTLHTNTAAGTFPRLIDLGVEPKVIGSAVNIALAQRLVRKLCESCKKQVPLSDTQHDVVAHIIDSITDTELKPGEIPEHIWEAEGCAACNNTGYTGRIGIFEGIRMNGEIEELVRTNPSEREIQEAARTQGILTMTQDGILKLLAGTTTYSELERVVELIAR